MRPCHVVCVPALVFSFSAVPVPPHVQAERLAAEAVRRATAEPAAALADARRALSLTSDFVPTEFVTAGRKGEVVEDAYVAAREAYRRHRAQLYRAVGESLAAAGRHPEATRYLRRALTLDGASGALPSFVTSLLAAGRPWEALDRLLAQGAAGITPETVPLAERAVDAAGLPSLQAELDRARIAALKLRRAPEYRDGPLRPPDRSRLSTGAPLRFEDVDTTIIYVAEASCRSCSADLDTLERTLPADARVLAAGENPDDDRALRQALDLYKIKWPFVNGARLADVFRFQAPAVLVVARRGYSGAVVPAPFEVNLAAVLEVFRRADLNELRPRAGWNRRPPERRPTPPQPALRDDGFAPGEDEPEPEAFASAVRAFSERRYAEALRLFESLDQAGDGWLLPPEARLNRGLCLARLGRREEARRMLLRTGDSRFQDAVDRALEQVAGNR